MMASGGIHDTLHYHPEKEIRGKVGSRAYLDVVMKTESLAPVENRTPHYK
jgi:hypothetical protein